MSDAPPPPPPPPPPPGTPPPPPPPPGGYAGGPGMPMAGGPRAHPQAGKWLAAAIVSIFCCAIVLGPVVWINTTSKLKEMDAQPGVVWTNRSTMNAARIVSIVSTVLGALSIVYLATTS